MRKSLLSVKVEPATQLAVLGMVASMLVLVSIEIHLAVDKDRIKESQRIQQPSQFKTDWRHLRGLSLQAAKDAVERHLGGDVVWDDLTNASKLPSSIDRTSSLRVFRFRNTLMRSKIVSVLLTVDEEDVVNDVLVMNNGRLVEAGAASEASQ